VVAVKRVALWARPGFLLGQGGGQTESGEAEAGDLEVQITELGQVAGGRLPEPAAIVVALWVSGPGHRCPLVGLQLSWSASSSSTVWSRPCRCRFLRAMPTRAETKLLVTEKLWGPSLASMPCQ
jgi:hypothetical protein